MIGIELELDCISVKTLKKLFDGVCISDYNFKVLEYEVIGKDGNLKVNLEKKLFNLSDGEDSVIFLNLQVYNIDSKTIYISNYKDFIKSKCLIIILITDNRFLEIYFNDENLKHRILENVSKEKWNYDIKTIDNDGRTTMSVI